MKEQTEACRIAEERDVKDCQYKREKARDKHSQQINHRRTVSEPTTRDKETRRKDSEGAKVDSKLCKRLEEREAGEVSVRVVFLDLVDDEVSRSAEGDVAGEPSGHAGVQERNHLALRVEDAGTRVALG